MELTLSIRICEKSDIPVLNDFVISGKHSVEDAYFETAFQEQLDGKRFIFLVFQNEGLVGYAHLNLHPQYTPFARLNIPEIQDIIVHPNARRQGIGEQLILTCEEKAKSLFATDIGIGVGVSGSFGSAQRLYHRLGYAPDGNGAVFERIPVQSGDIRAIDDRLCLMLIKSIN